MYICTESPNLAWWHFNWTDDDGWGFSLRCSIISYGGLWFCSSLWPSAIVSSYWTWLPQAGFSSLWSRGTAGGPSTVSSSRPGKWRATWATKRFIEKGKRGEREQGSDEREGREENRKVRHRRLFWYDRQAEWQTLINSSLWLYFTWGQACFHCYCFLPTHIVGDICSHSIMDEI